jgi:hypothetical protein
MPADTGSGVIIAGRQKIENPQPASSDSPPASIASGAAASRTPIPSTPIISDLQRNRELRIAQLSAQRTTLAKKIERVERRRKAMTTGQWFSFGTGLTALGAMGVSLFFGNQSYQDYQAATYTSDAIALREKTQLYQGIAITSAVLGGLGIASGSLLLATSPNRDRLQLQINRLDEEIEKLQDSSKGP